MRPSAALASLATLGLTAGLLTAAAPGQAITGRDTLFPDQGNGGYDVQHYDVALTYATGGNVDAQITITARAGRDLDSFHLDYAGPAVSSVSVGGASAATATEGDHELVVTPATPIEGGSTFTTVVTWSGTPGSHTDPDGSREGWIGTGTGAVALGEPVGAMTWLPSDNTPADKATFTFEITAPSTLGATANGELVSSQTAGLNTTWTWDSPEPMATYLAMVAIGSFTVTTDTLTSVDGREIPVWNYVAPGSTGASAAQDDLGPVLHFLEKRFGPYPFSSTGMVVARANVGYALETQTRPFYDGGVDTLTLVHEMAHQWYGDSVSFADWHDIWLAEGFATYAEWLWDAAHGGDTPREHFDALYAEPATSGLWSPAPVTFTDPADLFGRPVYDRGAMALFALRERIGQRHFAKVLRAWAAENEHGTVRTGDLLRLAERISGRQLDGLFRTWLRTDGKPSGY